MGNFVTEPKFTEQMRKLKASDPAHAELFNSIIGALLNNDVFLQSMMAQLKSDIQATIDVYYQQSSGYTDQKIAALINGAPTTLDTLGEIAQAMVENADVVNALNQAIGSKASEAEFDSYKKEMEKVLGTADISGIGDGTVTGAIKSLAANGAITEVQIVNALPSDAESHPTTLCLVKE